MHPKQIMYNGGSSDISISDTCPHCGKNMEPHQVANLFDSSSGVAVLTFRCTISECMKYFVLEYTDSSNYHPGNLIDYQYNGAVNVDISSNIRKLSPTFRDTFIEATIAEFKNLTNITGLAFRKSFEFLIKDFASYQNPEETDKIRKNSLNNVIDMFYKGTPKIQELLHITRRIGNDETHYYREFTDVDVKDLKKLIYNFSLYIDMILNIDEFSEKTS